MGIWIFKGGGMSTCKQRYYANFRRLLKMEKEAYSTTKDDFLNMTFAQKQEVLKKQKKYTDELFKII